MRRDVSRTLYAFRRQFGISLYFNSPSGDSFAAGLSEVIEVLVGDAHRSLLELSKEAPFDFVFIDAEKPGLPAYFDWALENIRLGGIIASHNAFRKGTVAGLGQDDDNSELMRQFNQQVANEERLISTIYPAGDGTLISVKVG